MTLCDGLNAHLSLARDEMIQFRRDFAAAIDLPLRLGCPLEEALNRLSPERLGGFYAWPATLWFRLDDAAKIYPLSMKHGQMSVFRLAAVMKEPVKPELLQIALHFTIQRFPGFATTVRKGFFWHYLDQTNFLRPVSKKGGRDAKGAVSKWLKSRHGKLCAFPEASHWPVSRAIS